MRRRGNEHRGPRTRPGVARRHSLAARHVLGFVAGLFLTLGLVVVFSGCGGSGDSESAAQRELWVYLDAGLLEPVPKLENVLAAVDSAADVGATGVVLEVRTRTGESLVPTGAFPVARDVLAKLGDKWLEAAIRRCQQRGLRVALGDRVFYGGNVRMRRGLVFKGAADWAVVRATAKGLIPDSKNEKLTWARLCPVHPEVQRAELEYLAQIARTPGIQGAWLEGVGFPDLLSGFGPAARSAFEKWLENRVRRWPDDVLSPVGLDDSLRAGPYLRQWLLWRAQAVQKFVKKAQSAVHESGGDVRFGVIVGGWLPRSFHQALNWAPETYNWTNRWLPPDYGKTSCLESIDQLGVGLFFPYLREKDAKKGMRAEARAEGFDPGWFSVEGCVKRVSSFDQTGADFWGVVHAGVWGKGARKLRRALKAASRFGKILVLDASTLNENQTWRVLRVE